MSYFVIDKECSNKIYDEEEFDIEIKEFKCEKEAKDYLNGETKSKMLLRLEKKYPGGILPNRIGKKWEDSEEIELLDEVKNDIDFKSIAHKHGRTVGAITGRLKIVALRLHNLDTPIEEIIHITRLDRTDIFDFIRLDEMKKCKTLRKHNDNKGELDKEKETIQKMNVYYRQKAETNKLKLETYKKSLQKIAMDLSENNDLHNSHKLINTELFTIINELNHLNLEI